MALLLLYISESEVTVEQHDEEWFCLRNNQSTITIHNVPMGTNSAEPTAATNSKLCHHSISAGFWQQDYFIIENHSKVPPTPPDQQPQAPLKMPFFKRQGNQVFLVAACSGAGQDGDKRKWRGEILHLEKGNPVANSLRMKLANYPHPLVSDTRGSSRFMFSVHGWKLGDSRPLSFHLLQKHPAGPSCTAI